MENSYHFIRSRAPFSGFVLRRAFFAALAFVVFAIIGPANLQAGGTTYTWDGGGGNGLWTNAANWNTAIDPAEAADANLTFSGSVQTTTTNNYATDTNIFRSIIFANGSADFTLTGNRILLPNNIVNNDTAGTHTINLDISATAVEQLNTVTGGTTVINGALVGTGGGWTINNGGTLGTAIFTASNSYTAATTIVEGVLNIRNGFALGTTAAGTTVQTGGELQLQGGISVGAEALSLSSTGSGTGAVTGGLRNISGDNTYGGIITLGAASRINSDSGTLSITNTGTITGATFALTLGGSGNIVLNSIIGTTTGTLTKDGAGTATLSGANTFTGATTISNGALRIASNAGLGTTAAGTTVRSGAALELSGGASVGAETLSIAGTGIDSGGALRNISGDNTYGGLLTLTNASRINSDAGTLSLTNTGTITGATFGLTLGGAGDIVLNSVIGTTTGTLTKDGAGTVRLGGINTYGGVTTIGGGVLRVTNVANAGTSSALGTNATITVTNGGILDYAGTTNSSMNRGINLASGNGGISVSNSSAALTISGVISNTGSFVKAGAGTLILSASNTYTGTTTISAGTLSLSGSGTISTNGLDLSASGATLNISNITATNISVAYLSGASGSAVSLGAKNMLFGGNNSSTTFAGVVSGSGNLTKTGTGTTTLSGANTYTGSAVVSDGTLNLANTTGSALGSVTNISVGNGATLLLSQSDQVNNAATVTLSGGTIQRGSGVGEVFGNLNLTASSFIDFGTGTGQTLSFGTYTPSALKLNVLNFGVGNTLTFSSNLSGFLPASSLGAFNSTEFSISGGFTSNWNGSTFTITAIPEPSAYLAAAGLLGLMLWPSRRRLLKDAKSVLGLRMPMRDRLVGKA